MRLTARQLIGRCAEVYFKPVFSARRQRFPLVPRHISRFVALCARTFYGPDNVSVVFSSCSDLQMMYMEALSSIAPLRETTLC